MTKQEAMDRLKEISNSTDTELAHAHADDVLCEFLKQLGHGDLVDVYLKIDKWYA